MWRANACPCGSLPRWPAGWCGTGWDRPLPSFESWGHFNFLFPATFLRCLRVEGFPAWMEVSGLKGISCLGGQFCFPPSPVLLRDLAARHGAGALTPVPWYFRSSATALRPCCLLCHEFISVPSARVHLESGCPLEHLVPGDSKNQLGLGFLGLVEGRDGVESGQE